MEGIDISYAAAVDVDLVLSIIHEIEEDKYLRNIPDNVYVTADEIISKIKNTSLNLAEKYQHLDLTELQEICETENGTFSQCLELIINPKNYVIIGTEKISKPLFYILEKLWKSKKLLVFPPNNNATDVNKFFNPLEYEYELVEIFLKDQKISDIKNKIEDSYNVFSIEQYDQIKFRSKIFEIIRLIYYFRYTPQINFRCGKYRKNPFARLRDPNIGFIKYVQEEKKIPPRSINTDDFFDSLKDIVDNGFDCLEKGDTIQVKPSINTEHLHDTLDIIRKACVQLGFTNLSIFQTNSIQHNFLNLFIDDLNCDRWCKEDKCNLSQRNLTIVADTGAGKTLAFLLGPLIKIVYKHISEPGFKVSEKPICLLIYPRRDLAFDQRTGLELLCDTINEVSDRRVNITVGYDYGGNIKYDSSIVTANIEAFKNRLFNPKWGTYLNPTHLKIIVIDEIHLYSGISGLHFIYFLRRLGSYLKNKHNKLHHNWDYEYPIVIGASATIAKALEHSKKLFSVSYDSKRIDDRKRQIWIERSLDEGKGKKALFHHIFMLPKKMVNMVGAASDITSGVLHNSPEINYPSHYENAVQKRGNISEDERKNVFKSLRKSLFFMDSKSGINRLHSFLGDIEKRNLQVIEDDNTSKNYLSATIYDSPIKFFPSLTIFKDKHFQEYPSISLMDKKPNICNLCKNIREIDLNTYLLNARKLTNIIALDSDVKINSILDGCTFFKTGLCWWFSTYPFTDIHNDYIINEDYTPDSIRSFRRTASLRSIHNTIEDLDELFVEIDTQAPYLTYKRLAVVSPVFEVGVDISNVKDILTYKTIRNIASYRQKTGRGGRESFSDIPVYTLISQRILDRYLFRSPQIIADPSFLETVPLKTTNLYFLKSHMMLSVFDYLNIWYDNYGDIYYYNKLRNNVDYKHADVKLFFKNNKNRIKNNMAILFSHYYEKEIIENIFDVLYDDLILRLDILLSDLPKKEQEIFNIKKPIDRGVAVLDKNALAGYALKSQDKEQIIVNLKKLLG